MTIQDIKSILKANQELLRGKVIQLGKEKYTSLKAFGLALLEAERKGLGIRFDTVWNNDEIVNIYTTKEAIESALSVTFTKLDLLIELTQAEKDAQMLRAVRNFGTSA